MQTIFVFFHKLCIQLRREQQHKVALAVLALLIAGGLCFALAEGKDVINSLWWAVVTMTTVGYGDISPVSFVGKLVGVVLMLTGIGFLGLFTASIASAFVESRILENKGMKAVEVKDHFVICGWNTQGEKVVQEMLADAKLKGRAIVILAKLEERPVVEENVFFVRGTLTAENMAKSCLQQAHTAILLADDSVEPGYSDAKMVMDVLSIRAACPDLYICTELADSGSVEHIKRAGANEVIEAGSLRSNLLVQAALDHGITEMVSELVSNTHGNELYKFPLPEQYIGKQFFEVLCSLKQERNVICLGIQKAPAYKVITNPQSTLVLEKDDCLLVIAEDRTHLT